MSLEQQVHSNDQTVKISKIVCIVFKVCMNFKKKTTTHKNKEIGVCVENDDDQ